MDNNDMHEDGVGSEVLKSCLRSHFEGMRCALFFSRRRIHKPRSHVVISMSSGRFGPNSSCWKESCKPRISMSILIDTDFYPFKSDVSTHTVYCRDWYIQPITSLES